MMSDSPINRVAFVWCLVLPAVMYFSVDVAAKDPTLRLSIIDADNGDPIAARVYLFSSDDEPYYFESDSKDGSAVRYTKQNRINQRSTEYHTTLSAHPAKTVVPTGDYRLIVERGKAFFPHEQAIRLGDDDAEILVRLRRWCDPATRNWFSGDTHLHRTIGELKNVVIAEDLNVALPLTNWVTHSDHPPRSGDKNLAEIPDDLVVVDPEHVIWPRNTEYEIFRVGEKRHTLGALFVLGHRQGLDIGVPPWRPVVESVRRSDPQALFDMDKLDWPFAMLLPTVAENALYELSNNHVWRTEFAYRDWNTKAPAYMQPPYGADAGGHRAWIDYSLGMYYTLLNCGFRLPPSAGTANGVHPVPAGFGRVYVHLPGGFEYSSWMKGLREGRSFVTTGPMLYATANGEHPGATFSRSSADAEPIRLEMEVESERALSYGEVLINGRPEVLLRPGNRPTAAGAFQSTVAADVRPGRSGWIAVRFWEPRADGQSRFVHSAPWYVEVDGAPVRPSAREKRYLIGRLEQEIDRSAGVVSDQAMNEYRQALGRYESLPEHDDSAEVAAEARPLANSDREAWLDNMIVDHRYDVDEVRRATGLSKSQASEAIEERDGIDPQTGFRILPYPGGRHPRIGFLDGAVRPQRETKVSVFPPWENGGYAVVDVPEAVFSNLGLTYLAHEHIPTIWDERGVRLPPLEWRADAATLRLRRELPNGIVLESHVARDDRAARMRIELTNGTAQRLTGLRVQVCVMLKGLIGFNAQDPRETVEAPPFVAIRSGDQDRWLITAWKPNHRVWTNPPVPCVHSDPIFPDCDPGQTVVVDGVLSFYEGTEIKAELERLADRL